MALIKCPECGREKVSDSAEACPDCGFGIKKYFEERKLTVLCDIHQTNIKYTYMNGFEEGVSGIYKSDRDRTYYVKEGFVYLPSGEPYFLTDKFLLPVKDRTVNFVGEIPEGNTFDKVIYEEHFTNGRKKWMFNSDGTVETEIGSKGVYKRQGEILVYKFANSEYDSLSDKPEATVIHNGKLYMFGYIKDEFVSELEQLRSEILILPYPFTRPEPIITERYSYSNNSTSVKCPYCQSTSTRKIGTVGRSVSFGLFGFGSSKVGKQWHCNNCKSDF